jgi:hypothetical protein
MVGSGEWPFFFRHICVRPWLIPYYGLELIGLIYRRLAQRARLRGQTDPHQGLKQRPDWLGPVAVAGPESGALNLPVFSLRGSMPLLTSSTGFHKNDPEAIYQRHRWTSCLAALGHDEHARSALQEVLTWIAAPPERSHPAWESYSCCERVANLAILLAAHPSLMLDTDASVLHRFFSESASWIDTHLEYYGETRTNNHFLNNGRALIIAGSITGNATWVSTGLEIVKRFAPKLFSHAGCLREGSSHYQLVVATWLFDALAFAHICVPADTLIELEELTYEVGRTCARFIASFPFMDVHIGDISPDLHPRLTLARLQLIFSEYLHEVPPVGCLGEWLFLENVHASIVARAVTAWPVQYTTHAHADLGSFIWLYKGHVILADPGRQNYLHDPATHSQLGPDNHNCMLVNGMGALAGSVLRAGFWYPRPYANATVSTCSLEDVISIEHTGFLRLFRVGKHKREVHMSDANVTVTDTVEGNGAVEITLLWHFASGYKENGRDQIEGPSGCVMIKVAGPEPFPSWHWDNYAFSASYGQVEPGRRLSLSWEVCLPCRIQTSFFLSPCAA